MSTQRSPIYAVVVREFSQCLLVKYVLPPQTHPVVSLESEACTTVIAAVCLLTILCATFLSVSGATGTTMVLFFESFLKCI